jgi:hypothetical protein
MILLTVKIYLFYSAQILVRKSLGTLLFCRQSVKAVDHKEIGEKLSAKLEGG